jgi:RNA polymerase sigma factor (sigma-70 family)
MTPILLRTQTDARLLTLAAAGHDRAFEAIVERYRKPLLRYLRRLLSEPLAEDVVQATFLNAWRALQAGTEVRELRPWLYRIGHNQAINALKRAGAALEPLPEGATMALVGVGPQEEFERREETRHALEGVAALPDRQRAALLAVAVEGRAHSDVAAELGLSDGAVRQLVHRARSSLRAVATAITPLPLATALASGHEVTAATVTELAAGAGGAGVAGFALKAGAVAATAGVVAAAGLPRHDPPRKATPPPAKVAAAPVAPKASPRGAAAPVVVAIPSSAPKRQSATRSGHTPAHRHRDSAGRNTSSKRSERSGRSSDDVDRSGPSGGVSRGPSTSSGPGPAPTATSSHRHRGRGSDDDGGADDHGGGSGSSGKRGGSDTSGAGDGARHGGGAEGGDDKGGRRQETTKATSPNSGSGSSGSGGDDDPAGSEVEDAPKTDPTPPAPTPTTTAPDDKGGSGAPDDSGSSSGGSSGGSTTSTSTTPTTP